MDDYITPEQVATMVNRSKGWVLQKARTHEIPSYKLGYNTILFKKSDVEKWISSKYRSYNTKYGT